MLSSIIFFCVKSWIIQRCFIPKLMLFWLLTLSFFILLKFRIFPVDRFVWLMGKWPAKPIRFPLSDRSLSFNLIQILQYVIFTMFLSNLFFEGDLLFIYVDIYRLSSLLNRVIKCFVQCMYSVQSQIVFKGFPFCWPGYTCGGWLIDWLMVWFGPLKGGESF